MQNYAQIVAYFILKFYYSLARESANIPKYRPSELHHVIKSWIRAYYRVNNRLLFHSELHYRFPTIISNYCIIICMIINYIIHFEL